jgi:MFS family permease
MENNTLVKKSESLWTQNFSLLFLINLFLAAGSFLLIPTLPLYAEQILKVSKAEIGYILGFYTITALLVRPWSGWLLDRFGRKSVYWVGLIAFAACVPLYNYAHTFLILSMIRIFHGLAWGIFTTSSNTLAADIVPPSRRGEGIGYFGMSFTIATAIGPVIGLSLLKQSGFDWLFIAASAIVMVTLVFAAFVQYPKVPLEKAKRGGIGFNDIFERDALPASLIVLICSGIFAGLLAFIDLYTKSLGYEDGSAFFILYAVGLTIIRPFAGRMMDKEGPGKILIVGLCMLSLGLMMIAFSKNIYFFWLASLVSGLGMGVIFPTILAMIINITPPERRGVANSTFFSAVDLGVSLGSILLGFVIEATSYSTMYFICALLVFVPLAWFYFYVLKDYQQKLFKFKI